MLLTPLSKALIASAISFEEKCCAVIAPAGQAAAHEPQPLQDAAFIFDFFVMYVTSSAFTVTSYSEGALYGHTVTHVPQPMHLASFTTETAPSVSMNFLDKIVQARDAAALACDMASSMSFGAWALPHRNTPSVAKSTGRSLG